MTKDRIVEIAKAAAFAHAEGKTRVVIAKTDFLVGPVYDTKGKPLGYCARFIRQLHEAALGLGEFEWPYRAANAVQMETNLKRAGLRVDKPEPGDIVCLNKGSGKYGHIAIYLRSGYIAENTSAGRRGMPKEPGTKITKFSPSLKNRVTGYYAAMPATDDALQTIRMIEEATGKVVGSFNLVPGGDHIADQGKVYVKV